jgi:plastocyanin
VSARSAWLALFLAGRAFADVEVSGQVQPNDGTPSVVAFVRAAKSTRARPSGPLVISQRDTRFIPELAVAAVGQTIEFPNDDTVGHSVFSLSPTKKFDLGTYKRGVTRSVVIDQEGIVEIFCHIHEDMHARIVVLATPYYAVVGENGAFTVKLPPGSYQVRLWHPSRTATATIRVADKPVHFLLESTPL